MSTTDALVTRFLDPSGFKKYIGFLGGKRAAAAHEVYSTAEAKGAAKSYILDKREYDGSHYYIRAIATQGDLDEQTLAELTREATLLPLGTVRYGGAMAPTLPDSLFDTDDAADVHELSRLDRGVIVYPVTELSKKALSSYALWARTGNEWFVYPIEDKKL